MSKALSPAYLEAESNKYGALRAWPCSDGSVALWETSYKLIGIFPNWQSASAAIIAYRDANTVECVPKPSLDLSMLDL